MVGNDYASHIIFVFNVVFFSLFDSIFVILSILFGTLLSCSEHRLSIFPLEHMISSRPLPFRARACVHFALGME